MKHNQAIKLICMSFDGDYVTEGEFSSVDEAWNRSNDMGSRWYFYPFHFVTTASGKTIKEAPEMLQHLVETRADFRKGQKILCIILPKIDTMMTGVWRIERAHDLTVLSYTDGQREGANIPVKRWNEIQDNVFSIVGEVQSKRATVGGEVTNQAAVSQCAT